MAPIRGDTIVDTPQDDRSFAPLHDGVRRFGPVFNTVAPGTELAGRMRRRGNGEAGAIT
jgi:hypothetical protein